MIAKAGLFAFADSLGVRKAVVIEKSSRHAWLFKSDDLLCA